MESSNESNGDKGMSLFAVTVNDNCGPRDSIPSRELDLFGHVDKLRSSLCANPGHEFQLQSTWSKQRLKGWALECGSTYDKEALSQM